MELLVIAVIVALVTYGLERNNRHTPEHPHLHGSTDVQNRDVERLTTDLQAHA
jgi:D-lyxose ketol-isomerase